MPLPLCFFVTLVLKGFSPSNIITFPSCMADRYIRPCVLPGHRVCAEVAMTISTGTSSPRKALAANAAGTQAETEAILERLKPAVIAGIGYSVSCPTPRLRELGLSGTIIIGRSIIKSRRSGWAFYLLTSTKKKVYITYAKILVSDKIQPARRSGGTGRRARFRA